MMILVLKMMILLIMSIGMICTLAPRLYGTLIILVAAVVYTVILGVTTYPSWVIASLVMLALVSEVGGRGLRIYLTRDYKVSRLYSIDTTVCNLAGIMVADALVGPLLGATIWEMLVGKALLPRLDMISKVLIRLTIVAVLRFICGLIMTIIIVNYILHTN